MGNSLQALKKNLKLNDKALKKIEGCVNSKMDVIGYKAKLKDSKNIPYGETRCILLSFMEDETYNQDYYLTYFEKFLNSQLTKEQLKNEFRNFLLKNSRQIEEEFKLEKKIHNGPIMKFYLKNTYNYDNTHFDIFQGQIGLWMPYDINDKNIDHELLEKKLNNIARKNLEHHGKKIEKTQTDFLDEDFFSKKRRIQKGNTNADNFLRKRLWRFFIKQSFDIYFVEICDTGI